MEGDNIANVFDRESNNQSRNKSITTRLTSSAAGKHTFEIVYPMSHRGMEATVGVGTETAPLHVKGRVALVGHNKHSWGICLRARRAFHKNAIVKKYPQTQV